MSSDFEKACEETDRRAAILMQGLQDFILSVQKERQLSRALLQIKEKAAATAETKKNRAAKRAETKRRKAAEKEKARLAAVKQDA